MSKVVGKNQISAEVLLGTASEYTCFPPIWTLKITFPRFCGEQLLKHRVFEICANSSRAMTVPKMNQTILDNPANPVFVGSRKKGMSPGEEQDYQITKEDGVWGSIDRYGGTGEKGYATFEEVWEDTKMYCMQQADAMFEAGIHQQIPNRLTHAFQMTTYILTGTDFTSFFNLRLAEDAQSEIQELARVMKEAMDSYTLKAPRNGWHLPYISDEDFARYSLVGCLNLSAARCCVVSYNNQDGTPMDMSKANKIYDMLVNNGGAVHYTPLGMQARIPNKQEYMSITRMQAMLESEIVMCVDQDHINYLKRQIKSLQYFANLNGWSSFRYSLENSYTSDK